MKLFSNCNKEVLGAPLTIQSILENSQLSKCTLPFEFQNINQQSQNFYQLNSMTEPYQTFYQQLPQQFLYIFNLPMNFRENNTLLSSQKDNSLSKSQRKITIIQNQKILSNEANSNQEIAKKKIIKQKEKKTINSKKLKSLAERNIMHNFASGVKDFIKYKMNKLQMSGFASNVKTQKISELTQIYEWIKENKKNFRCFVGWFFFQKNKNLQRQEMAKNLQYGKQFLKICLQFFKEDFAHIYILQSRITEQYKQEHYNKICKFLAAIKKIHLFNPNFFKK